VALQKKGSVHPDRSLAEVRPVDRTLSLFLELAEGKALSIGSPLELPAIRKGCSVLLQFNCSVPGDSSQLDPQAAGTSEMNVGIGISTRKATRHAHMSRGARSQYPKKLPMQGDNSRARGRFRHGADQAHIASRSLARSATTSLARFLLESGFRALAPSSVRPVYGSNLSHMHVAVPCGIRHCASPVERRPA
jgi:hypothetical protein